MAYGVGPQKIEKEKTCKIAKAMRVSPNVKWSRKHQWKMKSLRLLYTHRLVYSGV